MNYWVNRYSNQMLQNGREPFPSERSLDLEHKLIREFTGVRWVIIVELQKGDVVAVLDSGKCEYI